MWMSTLRWWELRKLILDYTEFKSSELNLRRWNFWFINLTLRCVQRTLQTKLTSRYAKFLSSSLCTLRWFHPRVSQSTGVPFSPGVSKGSACRVCQKHKHSSVNGHQYKMLCMTLLSTSEILPSLPERRTGFITKWHNLHNIQQSDFVICNFSLTYTAEENYCTPLPGLVAIRWRLVLSYCQPQHQRAPGPKKLHEFCKATWRRK